MKLWKDTGVALREGLIDQLRSDFGLCSLEQLRWSRPVNVTSAMYGRPELRRVPLPLVEPPAAVRSSAR